MCQRKYERVDTLTIDQVVKAVINRDIEEKNHFATKPENRTFQNLPKRSNCAGHMLRLNSVRLQTFSLFGTDCITCGIQGKFFAVERELGSTNGYHANLYAVDEDGNEVMMTHDHILARSLGGVDNTSNTQTMCTHCNAAKSVIERQILKKRKETGMIKSLKKAA